MQWYRQTDVNIIKDDDDKKQKAVKDGAVVRVPMFLMDGMDSVQRAVVASQLDVSLHQPGYATLTDAQSQARQRLYADHDKKLQDAWKAPAPTTDAKAPSPSVTLDAAYDRYEQRLRDSWRGGA